MWTDSVHLISSVLEWTGYVLMVLGFRFPIVVERLQLTIDAAQKNYWTWHANRLNYDAHIMIIILCVLLVGCVLRGLVIVVGSHSDNLVLLIFSFLSVLLFMHLVARGDKSNRSFLGFMLLALLECMMYMMLRFLIYVYRVLKRISKGYVVGAIGLMLLVLSLACESVQFSALMTNPWPISPKEFLNHYAETQLPTFLSLTQVLCDYISSFIQVGSFCVEFTILLIAAFMRLLRIQNKWFRELDLFAPMFGIICIIGELLQLFTNPVAFVVGGFV